MDLKQLKEQLSQQERNRALEDALRTQNPVLIIWALELGGTSPKEKVTLAKALQGAICLTNGAAEALETLLKYLKANKPEDFNKCLVNLADFAVDTERVDCMEVMQQYGLDLAYVNTKYCSESMSKYFEEQGIQVRSF